MAYDVDDWSYRLLTLVQMVGVLILALGLPAMFESFEHEYLDNHVMVLGYVVMRVPMVAQWARAAREDPARRKASHLYILTIVIGQVIWCGVVWIDLSIGEFFAIAAIPLAIELSGRRSRSACTAGRRGTRTTSRSATASS